MPLRRAQRRSGGSRIWARTAAPDSTRRVRRARLRNQAGRPFPRGIASVSTPCVDLRRRCRGARPHREYGRHHTRSEWHARHQTFRSAGTERSTGKRVKPSRSARRFCITDAFDHFAGERGQVGIAIVVHLDDLNGGVRNLLDPLLYRLRSLVGLGVFHMHNNVVALCLDDVLDWPGARAQSPCTAERLLAAHSGDERPWRAWPRTAHAHHTSRVLWRNNMNVQTVVVGIDGSDCGARALDAAVQLVQEGGTVHVVSAFDAPSTREISEAYAAVPEEFTAEIDLLAGPRAVVEKAVQNVKNAGYDAVDHFLDKDPASAILDTADEVKADLIVVGSRGLGRASRVLRGSVSTKIAHHSPIDFLVVH
ncbi:Universal stress protein YxiE [Nymphon striatum]|nr:Universal stress protein YxiE [Nymphon striatum]